LPSFLVAFVVFVAKRRRVEPTQIFVQLWVLSLNLVTNGVDVLELSWEFRQAVEEFLDDDDAETLAFAFSSEGFNHELKSDVLQDAVKQLVLNDCAEELCNLLKVLLRVPVQEPILIKETVEHAGVDFLLFNDLRFSEVLHRDNKLLDTSVDLVRRRREDVLEVLICSLVNFIGALGR